MKRFVTVLITILSIIIININISQALSLDSFTPALDKKVAKLKTTQEKVTFLQTFADVLSDPVFTTNKDARLFEDLREYTLNMLKVFQFQLKSEQNPTTGSNTSKIDSTTSVSNKFQSSTKDLPHLSDNFSNIDEEKVRNTILSRHNTERKSLGLNNYTYNLDLEGSATARANKLASSGKTKNLHVRNSGDGYYSYNSILKRFSDLGINFSNSSDGSISVSETVGYGYYKCYSSDCTQNLINAVQTTRKNLIMKEKSYKGSHYKAATMSYFTQMGVGISIDKSTNRYYIVIHYGKDFK